MTLRKITVHNSVRYVPKSGKRTETDIKPKKNLKAGSLPRKQDKKFSKNNKKFVKDFTAGRVGILARIMNCYL